MIRFLKISELFLHIFKNMHMLQVMNHWMPFTEFFYIGRGTGDKILNLAMMVIQDNKITNGGFMYMFHKMDSINKY